MTTKEAIEIRRKTMRIEEKMKNAKTTSWLTKGLTKEEVKDIVEKARKKGKREMEKMGGKTE